MLPSHYIYVITLFQPNIERAITQLMPTKKITFFLFFSLITAFQSIGQTGRLRIDVYNYALFDETCYQLTVITENDTVHSQTITSEEDETIIDSLPDGNYLVNVNYCDEPSDNVVQSITRTVEIKNAQIATLNFDFSQNVRYTDIDTTTSLEIITSRMELQLGLSYFDFRWNPDGNDPKFTAGIDYTIYSWITFSKHFGFLIGAGGEYQFAPLQLNSDENALYPDEIKSQYYNYFNAKYDMKFRFSTLNQQRADIPAHSVFIDVGAVYNLPLYFKRTTRFSIQDKMVNSFIHRYSDLRFYVNVGFTNVQLFASYRPFDMVRGDLPELPKYNAGVKLNFNFE